MTYSKRLQMPRELATFGLVIQWPVVAQYQLANKKPFLPSFQLASLSVQCPLKLKTEMKVLINHCIMQLPSYASEQV